MQNNYIAERGDYVYHLENTIIASIQSAIERMLAAQGIAGWTVARSNQPTIQAIQNNTVYFDIISKHRLGVQAQKPVQIDGDWYNATRWYEEWIVQLSAFKQRTEEDTTRTWTSTDVLTQVQACVNGGGNTSEPTRYAWWPESYINIVRSTDLREIDFETDSGLKEKMPQFDFTMILEQGLMAAVPTIDDIEMDVQPI